jgi:hypothetical protein
MFPQVHAALQPGGRLHAQCGGGRNIERLHRRALALMGEARFAPFYQEWADPWEFQDDATAERRMKDAGFATAKAWLEVRPTTLPSAPFFRDFVSGIVLRPHLSRLPKQGLRDAFMDEIVRLAGTDDPPYTLDYVRLNLEATA